MVFNNIVSSQFGLLVSSSVVTEHGIQNRFYARANVINEKLHHE
jgi:hypothetical protein